MELVNTIAFLVLVCLIFTFLFIKEAIREISEDNRRKRKRKARELRLQARMKAKQI